MCLGGWPMRKNWSLYGLNTFFLSWAQLFFSSSPQNVRCLQFQSPSDPNANFPDPFSYSHAIFCLYNVGLYLQTGIFVISPILSFKFGRHYLQLALKLLIIHLWIPSKNSFIHKTNLPTCRSTGHSCSHSFIFWFIIDTSLFWEWLKLSNSETHLETLFLAGNKIWRQF